MRGVARVGDLVKCPKCGIGVILKGSITQMVDGRPIARLGDRHSFGKIISGSKHFLVDGRPAARIGDRVSCKCKGKSVGRIIKGSKTLLVG